MNDSKQFSDTSSLSPRVYHLAQLVYNEFEGLQRTYGESAFKSVLPLTVRILEDLDQAYADKAQLHSELIAQMSQKTEAAFQLERSNDMNKATSKRLNLLEDQFLAYRKSSEEKVDKLESLLRQREMVTRNAREQAVRLEEREEQLRTELSTTHERYTELLKAYVDQLERTKSLETGSYPCSINGDLNSADNAHPNSSNSLFQFDCPIPPSKYSPVPSPKEEIFESTPSNLHADRSKPLESIASYIDVLDENLDFDSVIAGNSMDMHDAEDQEEIAEVPAEPVDEPSGLTKEIQKLIRENEDLCATKNALNIVKNDLIRKVDEVTGEKLMLAKELEYVRSQLERDRRETSNLVRQMHESQKRLAYVQTRLNLYESVDEMSANAPGLHKDLPPHVTSCMALNVLADNEAPSTGLKGSAAFGGSLNHLPLRTGYGRTPGVESLMTSTCVTEEQAGETTFTKQEIARLVADRNKYKESLIELQDAVRLSEEARSQRVEEISVRNSHVTTGFPWRRRAGRGLNFARSMLSSIHSAADEFVGGIQDLIREFDPTTRPEEPPASQSVDPVPPHDASGIGQNLETNSHSSELRHFFSKLIGHAASYGAEALFGTGNDFAASVTEKSLTDSVGDAVESVTQQNTQHQCPQQRAAPQRSDSNPIDVTSPLGTGLLLSLDWPPF